MLPQCRMVILTHPYELLSYGYGHLILVKTGQVEKIAKRRTTGDRG